jgi:hypothetical protein
VATSLLALLQRPVDDLPEIVVPPTTTPAERIELLSAIADEGARDPSVQALARRLVADAERAAGRPLDDRARLQALLDGTHALVQYRADPLDAQGNPTEVFSRARWTLTPRPFNTLSWLSGKPKGSGDCEEFASVFSAFARSQGLHADPKWVDQQGARLNHVAAVSCGLADVEFRPSGCAWVETSIAGAQIGETTDQALELHGAPGRSDLAPAGAPMPSTSNQAALLIAAGLGTAAIARGFGVRSWSQTLGLAAIGAGAAGLFLYGWKQGVAT